MAQLDVGARRVMALKTVAPAKKGTPQTQKLASRLSARKSGAHLTPMRKQWVFDRTLSSKAPTIKQELEPLQRFTAPKLPSLCHNPTENALKHLESNAKVTVTSGKDWIDFKPRAATEKGLIFYPGAMVESEAYASIARPIAEHGYRVVVLKLPMHFAPAGIQKAKKVMDALPQVKQWAVGGHSIGGIAAAYFTKKHPGTAKALVHHAAYPCTDLSKTGLKSLMLDASEDGLMKGPLKRPFPQWFPLNTTRETIHGGNHAQFGDYGPQFMDGKALISREKQHRQIIDHTVRFLKKALRS